MRAVLIRDYGDASVEEVPEPRPDEGEVLVEVERVQLSVTECRLYQGAEVAHHEQVSDRLAEGPSRLFGHEFCAKVREIGDEVTSLAVGDRVYAPGKIPCGTCRQCRTGFQLYCSDRTYIGYDIPGALAQYTVIPEVALCPVPETVSAAEVAAMQPLASAALCVHEAETTPGETVAVVGAGVMGTHCGELARLEGADRAIAIDIDPAKLDIADSAGMETIDATTQDPVQAVRGMTDGVGADTVYEAVGGDQRHATRGTDPLAQAIEIARPGGRVVQVGHIAGEIRLDPRTIRAKSLDWINPVAGQTAFTPNATTGERVARLVASGDVTVEAFVSHELAGLDEFETAVAVTLDKRSHDALGPAQLIL